MALTASMNILDIISENALMITLGTSPQTYCKYYSSEKWEHNLLDDPNNFPLMFMLRPLTESGKIHSQGNPESTYACLFFFFSGAVELNAPQSVKDPLLSDAIEMKRQFVIRLNNDSRIKKLSDYTCDEILEDPDFDINPCGVVLKLSVTIDDAASVCLT